MPRPALLPLITVVLALASRSAPAADPADEAAARAAVAARLDSLVSIRVECQFEVEYTPAAPVADQEIVLPDGGRGRLTSKVGVERSALKFSYLDGMSRFENYVSKETTDTVIAKGAQRGVRFIPVLATVRTFRRDAAEHLIIAANEKRGRIEPPGRAATRARIDVALGLRDHDGFAEADWLSPDVLRKMDFARDKDGRTVLTRQESHEQRSEFVFDPKFQYALIAYRLYVKDPRPAVVEVTAADFKPVNGVQVPHALAGRHYNPSLKRVLHSWQATITHCDVGSPANDEDHYYIAWPKGLEVVDARADRLRHRRIEHDGEKIKD